MTRKILYVMLILIMLFPINVYASSCNYTEQARLRKLATNIIPSYTYEESNNNVRFTITITNMNPDLYVIDTKTGIRYDYNGSNEVSIGGYTQGSKVKFLIYSTKADCVKSYLSAKYVNLPNYNKFYNDSLCKGMETYSVCAKWQFVNYNYDEFVKKIQIIKNENQNDEKKDEEISNKKLSIIDYISNLFNKYYIYIIGGCILFIFLVSFINAKKDKLRI